MYQSISNEKSKINGNWNVQSAVFMRYTYLTACCCKCQSNITSQSTQHLWDVLKHYHIMDVQLTNWQQLCPTIMLIWTKIFEQCLNVCHRELRKVFLLSVCVWVSVQSREIYLHAVTIQNGKYFFFFLLLLLI